MLDVNVKVGKVKGRAICCFPQSTLTRPHAFIVVVFSINFFFCWPVNRFVSKIQLYGLEVIILIYDIFS
jgi:hypothetical protein